MTQPDLTQQPVTVTGRSREQLAARVAADLQDGWCVNLGVGLPLLVPRYLAPDTEVLLHVEPGLVGSASGPRRPRARRTAT
jgi:3-oxoacid CoA-transferase subunit B